MSIKKYILGNPITPNIEWDLRMHSKNVKIEAIKSYIIKMASVLGIEGCIKLHICKNPYNGGSGMYWYKYQIITLKYPSNNLKFTLAHEFFHHFQYSKGIAKLLDINKNLYLYDGKEIKYIADSPAPKLYSETPIETDANEFAKWFCEYYKHNNKLLKQ